MYWRWVFNLLWLSFPHVTSPYSRMCPLWWGKDCNKCMLHGETIITSKEIVFFDSVWAKSHLKSCTVLFVSLEFLFCWSRTSSVCYIIVLIQNLGICWKINPLISDLVILLRFIADAQVCLHGNDYWIRAKRTKITARQDSRRRHTESACCSQCWQDICSEYAIHHLVLYFVWYTVYWDWDRRLFILNLTLLIFQCFLVKLGQYTWSI